MTEFKCPQIIAHRGASYYAPENTKAAIELAAQQGAKWIEVDLQLTRDNNIVIMHNSTVTKRTDGSGKILKMDFSELSKLDAGSWHSEQYVGEKILSLPQLIDLVVKLNLNVNLEIKKHSGINKKVAEIVCNTIKSEWPNGKSLPLLSSYSMNAMEAVKQYFPQLPRAIIISEWNRYWANVAVELDCVTINADRRIITPAILKDMHSTGKKVLIHTVNGLKSAEDFIKMGVDGLFTDRPDVIIERLQSHNLMK